MENFDLSAFSCLNLMPGANPSKKAYFCFRLNGIDKANFLNKYEVENIRLNGNLIKNEDIIYKYDNGFRFYTPDFKNNNIVNMTIRNKDTNKKYLKELKVRTDVAY